MSKVLRTVAKVATVVAAVAAVATTFGAALPAIAIGAGSISIAAAASAVAIVAGTVGSLTAKRPRAQGTSNQYSIDPQAGIPYPIGRTFFGGRLVHIEGYGGTENPYRSSVIVFGGGGSHEAIESVLIDRSPVTFSGGAATGYYSGFMWFTSQLGATPEAAALAAPFAGFPNWSSSHKLSGYAAGIWTVKFDPKGKVYASGTPEFGLVGKWAKVYDPRLDSTFPGGSGTCRALVESTYVWSDNAALHGLTWALGRWQNGKRALGVGIGIADIDVQAFVDAANNADANSWKAGGVMDGSGDKWNTLRTMLQAAGAEPLDLGGLLSCRFDSAKVSLTTIGSDDLADGQIRVPAMKTWRDRINGVIPRYRSEAHNWEIIPASAVRGSTYVTEDGEERTREVEFYCVQNVTQAAQHAGYVIVNSREIDGISIPLKTRFIGYRPGDCVTVNLPEANLVNQPVVITNRALDPDTGIVTITCRTETAAKHAFALGRTATPPPSASITAPADLDAIVWSNRTSLGQPTYRYPEAIPTDPVEGAIYIDANKKQYRFEGTALFFNGSPLTFGGSPITVSGWTEVQDAGISAAQATADAATAAANSALSEISNIASDNILAAGEKPIIIRDHAVIVAEQAGIDAQASAFGITTEKAAYDAAVAALTSYLATLTSPVAWNSVAGNTIINGATFRAKFADVYTAKSALMVKIDTATLQQPVLSRISSATGTALSSFVGANGLNFAQIAAVGEARDGDAVSFSGLGAVPKVMFLPGGNAATAGQNLAIQAMGLSVSGFTMKAKSQSVTPSSTVTDTGSTAGSGSEPTRVINRSSGSDPYDGRFTFSVTVTVGNIAPGEPGQIEVGLFIKQSGAWYQVGTLNRSASGTYTESVTPASVDFGAGNEFGVSVIFAEGTGTALTAFNSVAYTPGTVVETSLTPAGASPIQWLAVLQ